LQVVIRDALAIDGTDLAALLETRVVLEAETARLAAMRASADDRRHIARAQDAFRARAARGDAALEEDLAFHLAIATGSRNSVLAALVHVVAPDVMRHHGEQKTCDRARLLAVIGEHQAVCDAIAARDPDKAADAMTTHAGMARDQYRRTPRAKVVPVVAGSPASARSRSRTRAA
jgi:GntR family transcriptional repressor for pyruvate dehydrogenase complex